MMSYIKKVHVNPRLHVSVNLFIIWRMAAILRDSTVVPLAMITTRKSIHGFPLVSYMGMGLRYCCMIALIGHIVIANNTSCVVQSPDQDLAERRSASGV